MATEIRVLLVEEQEGRAELRKLLGSAQVNLAGEASFGTEALTVARQLKPDVVVLKLEEPVARPLKSIEGLILSQPNLIIVVVSSLGDRESLRKAMQAGARDYLVMPVRPQDLQKAVVAGYETEHHRMASQRAGTAPHRGDVISVFGVKGGIGKTSLTVNLAAAIAAQTQQRVGLLDLDLQFGDVAVMLNFVPDHTMADAAEIADRLDPELLQSLVWQDSAGLRILPAPLRPEEADKISPDQVQRIVSAMAQTYDYVLVDMPPMFSDGVSAILDQSTLVLLLTTQELFSLRRTKVALEMLKSWGYSEDKVKLVINYAYNVNGVAASDIERTLEYPIFWKVPNDAVVEASIRQGRPFVESQPGSRAGKNVVDLARVVAGLQKRSGGLMGKLWTR